MDGFVLLVLQVDGGRILWKRQANRVSPKFTYNRRLILNQASMLAFNYRSSSFFNVLKRPHAPETRIISPAAVVSYYLRHAGGGGVSRRCCLGAACSSDGCKQRGKCSKRGKYACCTCQGVRY
jgi:hypothetical protein